jgi:hypothetical protein
MVCGPPRVMASTPCSRSCWWARSMSLTTRARCWNQRSWLRESAGQRRPDARPNCTSARRCSLARNTVLCAETALSANSASSGLGPIFARGPRAKPSRSAKKVSARAKSDTTSETRSTPVSPPCVRARPASGQAHEKTIRAPSDQAHALRCVCCLRELRPAGARRFVGTSPVAKKTSARVTPGRAAT